MSDLRSPLAKVRGLGASGDATHHFWLQRLTAIALVPLVIWFAFSVSLLPEATHAGMVAWMKSPFNSTMLILLVVVGLHHGQLGMQVILEDYVSSHSKRMTAIIIIKFLSYFMMVAGVLSVLKLALGGV